jgi:hypothetical protein
VGQEGLEVSSLDEDDAEKGASANSRNREEEMPQEMGRRRERSTWSYLKIYDECWE